MTFAINQSLTKSIDLAGGCGPLPIVPNCGDYFPYPGIEPICPCVGI